MQAGFAMVEAGFTRAKNAGNIIMKNLMDFSLGALIYWAVGFTFMFGAGNEFIGIEGFFLSGSFDHLGLNIPLSAFWLFQAVFAATAATIVSGAMAERTKYSGYLAYSAVITGIIYPVVAHWIWGGGWLSDMVDFAGSTVVHSVGGWAALGVFILWFGWFGFNSGSTVSGTDLSIASIAITTNLAAAAVAVHGICGSVGTIMVGFLAVEGGLFYGGGISLLLIQLKGIISVAIWTFITAYILFKAIDSIIGLRVSREEELEGLDITEHGSVSYPDFVSLHWKSIKITKEKA